jgi:hypothetical protein
MSPELALEVLHSDFDRNRRKGGLRPDGPNGGMADTLDEAKAVFQAALSLPRPGKRTSGHLWGAAGHPGGEAGTGKGLTPLAVLFFSRRHRRAR